MLMLDTNVLSEIMKASPSPKVMEWWSQKSSSDLFISTVTVAEILYGIELLPKGRRQENLRAEAEAVFTRDFDERILPFDEDAARAYSRIASNRRLHGRPISHFDAQIAAIAHSHGAALATRNTADFEGCGLRLINPWI